MGALSHESLGTPSASICQAYTLFKQLIMYNMIDGAFAVKTYKPNVMALC